MQYMGSKNRLAKYIVPILQQYLTDYNIDTYIEPFVGGANVIDKINCSNRMGYDSHKYLIALLNHVRSECEVMPDTISQKEYNDVKNNPDSYEDWYVGLVGFAGSYSAKWFGGYAKGNDARDRQNEAIRNLINQAENLRGIEFTHRDFIDVTAVNSLIYCDPPYKGTTKYKTDEFPYEIYYDWARSMSKNNVVICSEYWMPDDFVCIWEKEHKTLIDSNRTAASDKSVRVEKLFIHSSKIKYI